MQESELQAVIAFWHDCLKTENATEQSFGISQSLRLIARSKALLFDGSVDPFIFNHHPAGIRVDSEELKVMTSYMTIKGEQLYYGYPLYTFIEHGSVQVAPLFIVQLDFDEGRLVPAEPTVSLGMRVGKQLGLTPGEVASLSGELAEIIRNAAPTRLADVLEVLGREVKLPIGGFNPAQLTRHDDRSTLAPHTFYNRAVIYTADTNQYNVHLLRDLDNLRTKHDLTSTALSYLTGGLEEAAYSQDMIPVLPFTYDPYQVRALQAISANTHTVVSGPPGTGKSQFIANLIVNLATQRKKVLLVSHTSEAVNVVNRRISDEFHHLMMHTGNKELRQSLSEQLASGEDSLSRLEEGVDHKLLWSRVATSWNEIKRLSRYVTETQVLVDQLKIIEVQREAQQHRRGIWAWVTRWRLTRQMQRIAKLLDERDSSQAIKAKIVAQQQEHVSASRAYVQATYLKQIFTTGNYGLMTTYVELIAQRKTHYEDGVDPAERYSYDTLNALNVWSCTLKSLGGSFPLIAGMFDYIIFDEASQIDLPSAAPALYRAKNLVVVGDDQQLSHITNIARDTEISLAKTYKLYDKPYYPAIISYRETSLFSSAKHALRTPPQQLHDHYRSNFAIANIFNQVFYDGKLNIISPAGHLPGGIKAGAFWMDVKGVTMKSASGSRYNEAEIQKVLTVLQRLVQPAHDNNLTIGIATPYAAQAERIRSRIITMFGEDIAANIRVLTAHQFQGSEVDILLFSAVSGAAGEEGSMRWFQSNPQVLNVAISRAKQLLVMIGDKSHALASQTKLKDIALMVTSPHANEPKVPAMNVFEQRLLELLIPLKGQGVDVRPQYLLDGFYTLDFALFSSKGGKVAVELDGYQHTIVGDVAVFEDGKRDSYLTSKGWIVLRVSVGELLRTPGVVLRRVGEMVDHSVGPDDEAYSNSLNQ